MHSTKNSFEACFFPLSLSKPLKIFAITSETIPSSFALIFRAQYPSAFVFRHKNEHFVIDEKFSSEQTIPLLDGQNLLNLRLSETKKPTSAIIKSIFLCALGKHPDVVEIGPGLFLLPFEAFYLITKSQSKKQRFFPFFKISVFEENCKFLLGIKIGIFGQTSCDLQEELKQGRKLKTNEKKHILVSQNASGDKYFAFESFAECFDQTSIDFHERFGQANSLLCQAPSVPLIQTRSLKTSRKLIFPASELYLLSRLKYQAFNVEKFYLCAKAVQILNHSQILGSLRISVSAESWKPKVGLPSDDFVLPLKAVPASLNLGNWSVFCFREEMEKAVACLYHLVESLEAHFGVKVEAPKCFYFDQKPANSLAEKILSGLQNKLREKSELVFVLTNSKCDRKTMEQVSELLRQKIRLFAFLDVEKNYDDRTKINKKVAAIKSEWLDAFVLVPVSTQLAVQDFSFCLIAIKNCGLDVSWSIFCLQSIQGRFTFSNVSGKNEGENFAFESIFSALKNKGEPKCLIFQSKINRDLSERLSSFLDKEKKIFPLFVKRSAFEIFPDVVLGQSISETKINFQNFRRFLKYENFLTDRKLEAKYELQLVYIEIEKRLLLLKQNEGFQVWNNGSVDLGELARPLSVLHSAKHNAFEFFVKAEKWLE